MIQTIEAILGPPVAFHPFVARRFGIPCALMISQGIFWQQVARRSGAAWFFRDIEQWETDTTLTYRQQGKAREKMVSFGFWEEKREGEKGKLFYKIDVAKLLNILTDVQETENPDVTKGHIKTLQNVISGCNKMSYQDMTFCKVYKENSNKENSKKENSNKKNSSAVSDDFQEKKDENTHLSLNLNAEKEKNIPPVAPPPPKKVKNKKEVFVYEFDEMYNLLNYEHQAFAEQIKLYWQEWIKHKIEINSNYAGHKTVSQALARLYAETDGDARFAISSIQHSIERKWHGIYKDNKYGKPNNNAATKHPMYSGVSFE